MYDRTAVSGSSSAVASARPSRSRVPPPLSGPTAAPAPVAKDAHASVRGPVGAGELGAQHPQFRQIHGQRVVARRPHRSDLLAEVTGALRPLEHRRRIVQARGGGKAGIHQVGAVHGDRGLQVEGTERLLPGGEQVEAIGGGSQRIPVAPSCGRARGSHLVGAEAERCRGAVVEPREAPSPVASCAQAEAGRLGPESRMVEGSSAAAGEGRTDGAVRLRTLPRFEPHRFGAGRPIRGSRER